MSHDTPIAYNGVHQSTQAARPTRRQLLRAVGIGAGAAALSGCVPGAGTDGGGQGGGTSGGGPLRLRYWTWVDDPTSQVVQDLAKAFNDEHDSVQVDVELMPAGSIYNQLVTAVNAGNPPDASKLSVSNIADLDAMGALVHLDDYFGALADADDLLPKAVLGSRLGREDNPLYACPWYGLANYLYYRKDWFADAGLNPPETTDEFLEACRRLTDADAQRYGFALRGGRNGQSDYFCWVATRGGEGALNDADLTPTFDRPENLAHTDWFLDMARTHHVVPPTAASDGFEEMMNNIKGGLVAMAIHHVMSSSELTEALGDGALGAVPIPLGPQGTRWTQLNPSGNVVYKDGQDPDAAWEWISYLSGAEQMDTFCQEEGAVPLRQSLAERPHYRDNPFMRVSLETADSWRLVPFLEAPNYAQLNEQIWPQSTQPALAGEVSAAEFTKTLADQLR